MNGLKVICVQLHFSQFATVRCKEVEAVQLAAAKLQAQDLLSPGLLPCPPVISAGRTRLSALLSHVIQSVSKRSPGEEKHAFCVQ